MSILSEPAGIIVPVTPHDSQRFGQVTRGIYVGTSGDVSVNTMLDANAVFKNVPAGLILPIRVWRVNATGTTAGNLLALW